MQDMCTSHGWVERKPSRLPWGQRSPFLVSGSEGLLDALSISCFSSPCSSGLGIVLSKPTYALQGLGTRTRQTVDKLDLWNPQLQ